MEGADTIRPWHRDRLAGVSVRQSTAPQVRDHQASTRLQYGLAGRAPALGWAADRVVVIDEDLGRCATTAAGRTGFQRLVSAVSRDQVGLILGVEMSRRARANKDRTGTNGGNGAPSSAPASPTSMGSTLPPSPTTGCCAASRAPCVQRRCTCSSSGSAAPAAAAASAARRPELRAADRLRGGSRPDRTSSFDPDAQVQAVVHLVFRPFTELGTLHGVRRYLADHASRLGVRVREGPGKRARATWWGPGPIG